MEKINQTKVTYFILKGISEIPGLQAPIFVMVLLSYLMCLGGNAMILLLVFQDPHLQTPMYFFLSNLSLLDISSTTVTLLKMLFIFISGDNTISFTYCMTQLFMFSSFQCDVLLLLAVMGLDRYVAICNPLHYQMIMSRQLCPMLVTICYILACIEFIPIILSVLNFTCYKTNVINHFFCDTLPLKKISCSDTTFFDLFLFFCGGLVTLFTPLTLTFISYILIINTILKIRSSTGRRKAFYTCSSHLTVVILLYTTLSCQYMTPDSVDDLTKKKLLSLFNTAAVPILNPLIYSLKNKDVKSSLRRILRSCKVSS